MEWVKLVFFMVLFAVFELIIGLILFIFVKWNTSLYIIFSTILILSVLIFFLISRIKEKSKIFPLSRVLKLYGKRLIAFTLTLLFIWLGILIYTLIYMVFFI